MQVSTLGIDLAKNVFQVHGVDAAGKVAVTRKLRRSQVPTFFAKLPPCLVGMEACATSHHWARELGALGHDVRLMPASYVKAYVKRNKNDAADAAAICEAVTRPSMRFVAVKTAEQQALLMLHRTHDLLVRQRTQLINAIRAHLAELGLIAAQGRDGLTTLIGIVGDKDSRIPDLARKALHALLDQLDAVGQQIGDIEVHIHAEHRSNEASRRLETIPGIGVVGATAIVAAVPDAGVFKSGREFEPGWGWCRDRTPVAAKSGWARSPSRATAICDGCSWSARQRSSGTRARIPTSIPGSCSCWHGGQPRRWQWRLPTRWRASPGRCWPRARPIERRRLRQRHRRGCR
jgi:transposase